MHDIVTDFCLLCSEKALFGVSSYYQANASVNVHEATVYWLNNFDNIYQSYGKKQNK